MPAANRIAANLKLLAIFWMVLSVITRLIPGLFLVLSADVAANFLPPDAPGVHSPAATRNRYGAALRLRLSDC